jgi:hypothetical protein
LRAIGFIFALFGISFRLEFDSLLLNAVDSDPGTVFAGRDPLFLSVTQSGYVAIGLSLKGNQQAQGVSGNGSLATLVLSPKGVGVSAIRIRPETLELIDWQGNRLPRSGILYIEDGEVQIVAP